MPQKHSKRYNSAIKVADLTKEYPLPEAVEILTKFPKAKFDETVELSFRLAVDATSGDQNVRGTTPLPNGSGKQVRVLVFTDMHAGSCAVAARVACRAQGASAVVCGVNLPMLLDFVFHRELPLDELVPKLVREAQASITGHLPHADRPVSG